MAVHKSGIFKTLATALRAIQFLAAIVKLAVLSTYLARLSTRNAPIGRSFKGAEGIAGAEVLYTAFAILLTCCLGGKAIFAFIAIALDICFVIANIAVAVITRGYGTSKCFFDGPDVTVGANGDKNRVYVLRPKQLRTDCHLVKSAFAVAIISAFLFLVSAAIQRSVQQASVHSHDTHHTTPRTSRFPRFGRKNKATTYDAEMATRH